MSKSINMCKYDHYATVVIKNNTGGKANIRLTHQYGNYQQEQKAWQNVGSSATTSGFNVHYNTGIGSKFEYWWVEVDVLDGPNRGTYYCGDKECYFKSSDAKLTHTFEVDTSTFYINMRKSSGCKGSMSKNPFY